MDLKVIRACLRQSQAVLAQSIGIDRRRVSEIENGERELRPGEKERLRELLARETSLPKNLSRLLAAADSPGRARRSRGDDQR